jgi:hypothetical protein
MSQIPNISRILTKVFIFIVLFLVSCADDTPLKYVEDSLWNYERERSESFAESNNNYCLINRRFLYPRDDIYNREKLGLQIAGFLENKNINIKKIEYIIQSSKMSLEENKTFIEKVKEQVKKDNYKDCDFLILYVFYYSDVTPIKYEYWSNVLIILFDIRKNKEVSFYRLMGISSLFFPSFENFLDDILNKWWKRYQEIK